jgi:hypothetical protein
MDPSAVRSVTNRFLTNRFLTNRFLTKQIRDRQRGQKQVTELMRFELADGGHIVVEVDEDEPGVRRIGREGGVAQVRRRFEEALGDVRDAAAGALRVFRDGRLNPDEVEITFGVRLNAEAGAVISKTAIEGHLAVKLTWARSSGPADGGSDAEE